MLREDASPAQGQSTQHGELANAPCPARPVSSTRRGTLSSSAHGVAGTKGIGNTDVGVFGALESDELQVGVAGPDASSLRQLELMF